MKGPFEENMFYTTTELIELGQKDLFPIKTMATLNKLINKGVIKPVNIGTKEKKIYRIKGSTINDFIKGISLF